MKLLLEQKLSLEKKLEALIQEEHELIEEAKENVQTITRMSDSSGDSNYAEYNSYKELLIRQKQERIRCEQILQTAQLVTHFNNEQIDIGTTFLVQLDGYPQEKFTMVETNEGVSSLDGYITASSVLGQALFGKKQSETFKGTLDSGEKFQGQILQIVPQKDLSISPSQNLQYRQMPSLESSSPNLFLDYYASLSRNSEEDKKEMERLNGLTPHQAKFLRAYYEEKMEENNRYGYTGGAIVHRLEVFPFVLKKKIIVPRKSIHPELGESVLLELIKPNERLRKEYELVPNQYANERMNGFLSIRQPLGFFAYRAQLGESFVLSDRKTVRVAQFGIPKKGLLFPLSANYSFVGNGMKAFNQRHENYIFKKHPTMTASQKMLFDRELEKVCASSYESDYSRYILKLAACIKKGDIKVQDPFDLKSNGDQVGLGSKITGFGMKDGKFVERTHEVIECAFTTETRDHYVEYAKLKKGTLIGRKAKDKVTIQGESGKMDPFYIMEVCNEPQIAQQKVFKQK